MHVGMGASELVVLLVMLFGGGATMAPIGVPLEPDAGLQSAAPLECLLYLSYAGQGVPRAGSKNEVEQLYAEPEIQAFIGEVDRLIREGLKQVPTDNEEQRILAAHLPTVVRTLLVRPTMLYVGKVDVPPAPPGGNAAIVVNAGDKTPELIAALEEFEKLYLANVPPNQSVATRQVDGVRVRQLPLPPGVPPLAWGVKDEYVFVALGQDEPEQLLKRLAERQGPPAWLADLQKEMGIARQGGLAYVNLGAIIKTAEPLFPLLANEAPPPLRDIGKLLDATGLRHLKYLAFGSGLGEESAVSKVVIAHDGVAEGLLSFAQAKPLSIDDLRRVPADVEVASVGRFDVKRVFDMALNVLERIDPDARKAAEAQLGQAEEELGFSLEKDLFASLGDTWSFYSSAREGGLLLTGLCLTVAVRDQAKLEGVIERALRKVEAESRGGGDEKVFDVRKTTVGDKTISYVQILGPSPVAPAWCFDGDSLVIALSPQMVRTHVARSVDAPTLADSKLVKEKLSTGDVTSLSYQDTQLGWQALYSYAQFLATMGAGALEKETGVRADITKFPSFGAISRHMRPSVHVTRVTKSAVLMESYATGPTVDLFSAPTIGVGMALLLPAVSSARATAREMSSMNNMRMISTALIMYEQEHGKLPKNFVDQKGNPVLSWRIALLPYLDQRALYDRFHLDEPWDSEHNKPLAKQMPQIFAHPSAKFAVDEGKTVYLLPTGPGTLFDAREVRISELNNAGAGTYNAAMLLAVGDAHAVAWTKPQDVKLDLQNFAGVLRRDSSGFAIIGFADGSVRRQPAADLKELEEQIFPR